MKTQQVEACPICEQGMLEEFAYSENFEHRGSTLAVDGLRASRCSACAEVLTSLAQVKANRDVISVAKALETDAKRNENFRLSSGTVRSARQLFGLTQKEAAVVFGGGSNAFSKYERGEVMQSEIMDNLLRVCISFPEAGKWLVRHAAESGKISLKGNIEEQVSWIGLAESAGFEILGSIAQVSFGFPSVEEADYRESSQSWKDVPQAACAGWR